MDGGIGALAHWRMAESGKRKADKLPALPDDHKSEYFTESC